MIKIYIKYLLCLISLESSYFVVARDCENNELEIYHQQLKEFIKRYKPLAAISYADSVLQILEKKGQKNCLKTYWIKFERAEAFEHNKKFEDAIQMYHEILRKADDEKWWSLLTNANISIARCYETIDRPTECLNHLNTARTLIEKENLDSIFANFCTRYSSYHRIFGNKDSAIVYANLSIQLGQKFKVPRSVFDGHLLMGILLTDLDSSIIHFRHAVRIFEENGDYHGAASQSMNISMRYIKVNKFSEAAKELENANTNIGKTENDTRSQFHLLSRFHDIKRIIFENQGLIDSAYAHIQLSHEYNQKAEWHINQENITANAIEFAIEKEKEKTEHLEKISSLMQWGLSIMGLFILIFLFLLIKNQKNKLEINEQNKIIQSRNELLEQSVHKQSLLLSEVHHRVKNNLQLVISLLTLKISQSKSDALKQFAEEVSAKVRGIALIHEQLYSTGDFEHIDIKEYLSSLVNHFNQFHQPENAFDFYLEVNPFQLNLETVMPIGIICSELVGNSLKYARIMNKKLFITIKLISAGDKYAFYYSDNGPGLSEKNIQKKKLNMGLNLINSMVRQLQAESSISNHDGATFSMNFVEKKISKV